MEKVGARDQTCVMQTEWSGTECHVMENMPQVCELRARCMHVFYAVWFISTLKSACCTSETGRQWCTATHETPWDAGGHAIIHVGVRMHEKWTGSLSNLEYEGGSQRPVHNTSILAGLAVACVQLQHTRFSVHG